MPRPKKSSYTNEKPPLSYVALCAMAIRSSSSRMMSLNEIYRFIINTFPYYKNTSSKWRNSLRHNLSFNDCFVKIVQGSENGNKRSLWSLHPNCGDMFEDGSLLRRKRRFTSKIQKDDGNPLNVMKSSIGIESKFLPTVEKHQEIEESIPKLRDVLKIHGLGQHGNFECGSFTSEEKRPTNFTIENILGDTFPPQKKEVSVKEKLLNSDAVLPGKNRQNFDVLRYFDRDRIVPHKCTCFMAMPTPYCRNGREMPTQRYRYQNFKLVTRHARDGFYSPNFVQSSRETKFTLHYKSCSN